MKINKTSLLVASLIFFAFFATFASANVPATSISTVISRADTEIATRIQSLNDLITRIGQMKKVSTTLQETLTSSVQNEITQLTTLKTKIDTDTNLTTAKTDYQSITKSYRIYLLVLPQVRIIAAADRVLTIVDSMNAIGTKVQSRMAGVTGSNATTLNQKFSDFTEKVTDAGTQSRNAANEVLGLKPDQGNQTTLQANTIALKDAKSKIKIASDDLTVARKDIGDIINFLKENNTVAQ